MFEILIILAAVIGFVWGWMEYERMGEGMSIFGWDREYIGGECPKCGKCFSGKQTTLTIFSYRWFILLRMYKHFKTHGIVPLRRKELLGLYWKVVRDQTLSILFIFILVPIVYWISWITYPFWWIHEFIEYGKVK
ncbi:hypothetical protein [Acetobacterium wieringae]|uniref:hypothetical protein n=1 Tax=Acetobacterium wieringae TaxID=52694 RepID=UPI00315817DE